MLSQAEHLRYSRQVILNEIGISGQERLKGSSAVIVGAGGLGSPLAFYLAAAGVGHLGIIDFDFVGTSNLHRQILHTDEFLGAPKLESAMAALQARNPHIRLTRHDVRLQKDNAVDLLSGYDIVADCSDNFATRYLVNDASVLLGIPNVYGSVYQFEGQITVFGKKDGPCYRCLHPSPPPSSLIPNCAESGILGVLPGLIGTLQANEVLKLLLDIGKPLIGHMTLINALTAEWHSFAIEKRIECSVCGETPMIDKLDDDEEFCSSSLDITPLELNALMHDGCSFFLLDVRNSSEAAALSMGADLRIPLDKLSESISEITADFNERVIVHCQTGVRSRQAVELLRSAGFTHAASLDGGILAWMEQFGNLSSVDN